MFFLKNLITKLMISFVSFNVFFSCCRCDFSRFILNKMFERSCWIVFCYYSMISFYSCCFIVFYCSWRSIVSFCCRRSIVFLCCRRSIVSSCCVWSAIAKNESVTKKNVMSFDNVVMNESLLINVNDVFNSINEFRMLETNTVEWIAEKLNFVENRNL